ncbi:hypothetical protein [Humisphaera borealis]|uniref:Uncharacterized protein n=1 Tax=Humisphaera borealis TaxID=2807512 RepID=A0A7M2WQN9_9BACT|nr:hypothetical protein [Humisphaera borealis]QOV87865.1 hypothetical protein IPV69_16440 [Humisphaera borealis]
MATDIESNPLFGLLTDALRAGPGSPEWHQAVAKLRSEGLADSDEYRLLVQVRENLESGRDYRSVRAGPGFTRKVLEGIENEKQVGGAKTGGIPLANVIAVISVIAIIGVLAYLGYQLFPRPGVSQETVEELEKSYLPTEVASAKFDGTIPSAWRKIGALPLESTKAGLKPAPLAGGATQPSVSAGGALLSPIAVVPEETFAVIVQLKPGRPSDDLIVQVFVSTEDDFSADKAISSNELVWLIQGSRQKVIVRDSQTEYNAERPDPTKLDPITVRLAVSKSLAVVSNGGTKLWAGNNGLTAKPRTVGVRFIQVDPTKPVDPTMVVQSIRIVKK